MKLLIENLIYSTLFIGIALLIGYGITLLFKVKVSKNYFGVFLVFLIGFFTAIGTFAILITNGRTILVGLIIISFMLWFDKRNTESQNSGRQSSIDDLDFSFLSLKWVELVIVSIFIIGYRLCFAGTEGYLLDPMFNDYVFYSKISRYLLETGHENTSLDYIFFDKNVSPYHYADIWINSLLIWATRANAVTLMTLSSYTIGIAGVWLGFVSLIENFFTTNIWTKILAFLLVFSTGMYWGYAIGAPFIQSTSTFTRHCFSYPKLFPIFLIVILLIHAYSSGKKEILITCLLLLPLVNISTTLGTFILISIILLDLWRQNRSLPKQMFMKILSMGIFIALFFTIGQVKSFGGNWKLDWSSMVKIDYIKTSVNIVAGAAIQFALMYSFLIILFGLILWKKNKSDGTKMFSETVIIFFSFILPWAMLHRNPNSVQLFSNFFVPFVSCFSAFITLKYLGTASLTKGQKIIGFISLLSLPLFALVIDVKDRIETKSRSHLTLVGKQNYVSFFSKIKNPVGVYFNNEYDWASKATTFATPDLAIQQFVNRPRLHTISLSIFEIPIDTNSLNYEYEKSLVESSIFQKYIRNKAKEQFDSTDKIKVEDYQLSFIKDYNIEYLLTNYKYVLPARLKLIVKKEFADEGQNIKGYTIVCE